MKTVARARRRPNVPAAGRWTVGPGLRSAPQADAVQPDLFSGTQVVQRTLSRSGSRVRLRLQPLGDGRVRVVEAFRLLPGARSYEPWPEESGRETDLARLHLGLRYEELFHA